MKVSPVSGDLLVQLVLIAAGMGLAVYLVRRSSDAVSGAVGSVVSAAEEVADSIIVGVNPSNPSNWVNQTVTSAGAAFVSPTGPGRNADGSWTLGGAAWDFFHPDPVGQMVFPPKPKPEPFSEYGRGGPSTGVYGVVTPDNFDFQAGLGWGGA